MPSEQAMLRRDLMYLGRELVDETRAFAKTLALIKKDIATTKKALKKYSKS
jgi:hypothetical protein